MKPAQYLISNFKWVFSKPDHSLVGQTSTHQQLFDQLRNFCQNCTAHQRLQPNLAFAQFDLNHVFLSTPQSDGTRHLKSLYFHYANKLVSAKVVLSNCPSLPACDGEIVLETLAKMFVVSTQASKQTRLWKEFCHEATNYLSLSEQDLVYLNAFYDLYLCKYYCQLYKLAKKDANVMQLCHLTSNTDLICLLYNSFSACGRLEFSTAQSPSLSSFSWRCSISKG